MNRQTPANQCGSAIKANTKGRFNDVDQTRAVAMARRQRASFFARLFGLQAARPAAAEPAAVAYRRGSLRPQGL